MKQFFRDQDGMGATPQMSYKKKDRYGTVLGGCCSCCASVFVLVYVVLVFSGFVIGGRDYNQTTLQKYQPNLDPSVYNLSPYEMMPVVQILSGDGFSTYNDKSLWKITFFQVD